MKINLQINKMMIKMNKQRYFDVSFMFSRASWGVLGCLGVSWGNKTDPSGIRSLTEIKTGTLPVLMLYILPFSVYLRYVVEL